MEASSIEEERRVRAKNLVIICVKWQETYLSAKLVANEEPIFYFYDTDETICVKIIQVVVVEAAMQICLLFH